MIFFSGYLVVCVIDRRARRLISPSFIISFLFPIPVIYHRGKADNQTIEILLLP